MLFFCGKLWLGNLVIYFFDQDCHVTGFRYCAVEFNKDRKTVSGNEPVPREILRRQGYDLRSTV